MTIRTFVAGRSPGTPRQPPPGLGGGLLRVANVAALAAVPGTATWVWVESLLCFWEWVPSSALAPDGITAVAALGGGNWERVVPTTAQDWLTQAAWGVDPLLGNDENVGSVLSPLATTAELDRRLSVGPLAQDTTLTVVANAVLPAIDLELDTGPYTFSIVGTPATVHAGVVDSYTDRVHATPIWALFSEAAFDFTPYPGYRLRVTAGAANGALAWIDVGDPRGVGVQFASVSRFSRLVSLTGVPTVATPVNGNTYLIEQLPRASGLFFRQRNRTAEDTLCLYVSSMRFFDPAVVEYAHVSVDCCGRFVMDGSHVDGTLKNVQTPRETASWKRCRLGGTDIHQIEISGEAQFYFCLFNASFKPLDGGNYLLRSCLISRDSGSTAGIQFEVIRGHGQELELNDVQVFGADGVGAAALSLRESCNVISTGGLSGDGNLVGLLISSVTGNEPRQNVQFAWGAAADLPNLLGTTADIRINGTAPIDLTWAEVPFNSDAQSGIGTLVAGTAIITARNSDVRPPTITRDTPGGAIGDLSCPIATRAAGQFVVNSANVGDTSTFIWSIPAMARSIVICQADSLVGPI